MLWCLLDAIASFEMDSLEMEITALFEGIVARDQLKFSYRIKCLYEIHR